MKKKRLTILAISVIMFLGISATLIAQNMVTNPGFENWTGGVPDDWALDDQSGDCSFSQEVGGGVTGDAIMITANNNGSGYDGEVSQIVTGITEGTNYNFSIMVRDNTDVIKVRWWCKWQDDTGSNIGDAFDQAYLTTNSEDWQLFEVATATAPTEAVQVKYAIRIYFSGTPAEETILLDDASLTVGGGGIPISEAYSISLTEVDVLYNTDLTSVNAADYTLTGSSTITFSNATIDDDNHKLVHLTGASDNMIGDTTLDNIYDAENDTDFDFYAGITPIALTNTLNPDGHIVNGEFATFQGIVSANDDYNNVWVSDDCGAYNGVLIYDYDFDGLVAVGDEILFVAKRDEYYNLTELKDPILVSTISTGNLPYSPADISGSDIGNTIPANTNPAEQWEGQLVAINDVLVASTVSKDDMYIGSDDSWVTTFVIGDNVDYNYSNIRSILDDAITSGEPINIKGVVDWNTSENYYRINPRTVEDLPVDDYPNPVSSSVLYNYPNPVRTITTISYNLAADLHEFAQIEIYNVNGQLVKQFPITNHQSSVEWNGTDENGRQLSNGIYFYKLTGDEKSLTKKMLLLR
jgi:hypothetical protein